jgi:hypothetical protein
MANNQNTLAAGIFTSALQNRRVIDEVQLTNLASELDLNVSAGDDITKRFRTKMEEAAANPDLVAAFHDFKTYGAEHEALFIDQRDRGALAAVDGTDRLSPISFPATQLYVAGVSWATTLTRSDPTMYYTSTTADLRKASSNDEDDLWKLAEEIDRATKHASWNDTIREFCERETALNLPDTVETVLIDGPIFTQNLMTQVEGRELMRRLVMDKRRRYIGVIKELKGSWALSRWAADALKPGEVYVLASIQDAFTERFESTNEIGEWLRQNTSTYVRSVYCPGHKSYAFECALEDLPYAVNLLRMDASPQINHETPRLLGLVDAACRRSNNSNQIRNLLISQVQQRNHSMAANLSDERNSR